MLSEDFNVQLEDGSAPLVARALLQMHSALLRGDTSELERLRTRQNSALAASRPEKVARGLPRVSVALGPGSHALAPPCVCAVIVRQWPGCRSPAA